MTPTTTRESIISLEGHITLCERVLQPIRDHFNHTVTISSGYRNEILSQKIGSSRNSQHCKGEAADFEIFGTPNNEVSDWIKENLMFDQLNPRIF